MMSQEMLTTMSSYDSGQGESICTPKRAQKCLFNKPGGSSSTKRNLMKILNSVGNNINSDDDNNVDDDNKTGDESDLGPMSPLAMTDCSSDYNSSPGRQYDSPFTSPEKLSPRDWDRLRPKIAKNKNHHNNELSPFAHLKKVTRAARSSPSRKLDNNSSPKLIPRTPERIDIIMTDDNALDIYNNDVIVPETPQKDDIIVETPKKKNNTEKRMKTPLGSITQSIISVPPLHRRKSLSALDNDETSSPERVTLKRTYPCEDISHSAGVKFPKTDDNSFIVSRARAALFQDDQNISPKTKFTLSTKSFYSNNVVDDTRLSSCFGWKKSEPVIKKRHSLPSTHLYNRRSGGHSKKSKLSGGINAGVMHGIKKRKKLVKRHSGRVSIGSKNEDKKTPVSNEDKKIDDNNKPVDNIILQKVENNSVVMKKIVKPIEIKKIIRPPSPVEDPNKRFFKTNRTLKTHHMATVTVNGNIKLKVSDGKIALKEKRKLPTKFTYPNKKQKHTDLIFDTTDLSVDEPGFNTPIEQNEMDGILKTLEDDWADDEYDTMELLVNKPIKQSPHKANILMSPGSVLINLTSSMNIEDQTTLNVDEQLKMQYESSTIDQNNTEEEVQKFYPLFAKGFKDNTIENISIDKNSPRGMKRGAWQLSSKLSGGDKQYQLDAGQKRFGATQCQECGVVYQMGEPEDENSHLIFHNSFKTLKFNGWKNENIIVDDPFTGSRVITIKKTDSKHCWKKVEEILGVVDRDLGLADMELTDYQDKTIYLYIRNKNVVGVLIAESIKEAHEMIPELIEINCCSTESTPAKCGVNVIWTAMSHRRQHIATKLLDILRTNYFYGYILSLDDIAFSMPTPTGRLFAEKYVGTRSFKVYN